MTLTQLGGTTSPCSGGGSLGRPTIEMKIDPGQVMQGRYIPQLPHA